LCSWLTTPVAAAARDRVVEVHVAGGDPEGVRMPQLIEQRGALEQALAGMQAAVGHVAADLVLLHQDHAQAQLGARIAAG